MKLKNLRFNLLIVIEGLPCSGKTRIVRRLAKELPAALIPELDLRVSLRNRERINFYTNDFKKSQESCCNSIKKVVVMDRYFLSTIAFEETLKSLSKRKLFNSRLMTLYDLRHCCGEKFYFLLLRWNLLKRPDIVFYLKVPVDVSMERQNKIKKNSSKYNIWRNKKFLHEFQRFCLKNAEKYYSIKPIIINASLSFDEIYPMILKEIEESINSKNETE